jgi:hypothetical protein
MLGEVLCQLQLSGLQTCWVVLLLITCGAVCCR